MKLGIVGLPNVGKSTLFNAITSTKNAEAANYPFCTIEPNSGIVAVPDKRLDKLAEIWQTNKKTPAIVEFVDIAGLVKGASQGAGLGNKFLGHTAGAVLHHFQVGQDQLIVDGVNVGNRIHGLGLGDVLHHMDDVVVVKAAHEMGLLSAKPVLYACNVGEDDLMEGIENNKYVPLVAARAKEEGARYIPICAKTEEDIADYSPEEKKEFLAEMGIEASGLDNLITASYDLLGLISFLTDGKKECRAWTIRKGTKAPQAAGKIHSDFERGFIRASVIGYKDLEANNFDYAAVKAKGLQRTEGKEYVVKDGDVIEFLFNV